MGHKRFKKLLCFVLALSISIGSLSAFAAFEDYPDGESHWSSEYLRRAVDDGLIEGYGDGLLHPEANMTYPQALAIICRILNPIDEVPYSYLGLSEKDWYAPYAAKLAAMGTELDKSLFKSGEMTRAQAFSLLADAFGLIEAAPDYSVLSGFSDASKLSGKAKDAFAALVSGGYVEGSFGYLNPNSTISRAEFIVVCYRIISGFGTAADLNSSYSGGYVVSGDATIYWTKLPGTTWFTGSDSKITLNTVTADTIIYRAEGSSLSLVGTSTIERLVIAGHDSASMDLDFSGSSKCTTVVIGDNAPETVNISGNVSRVEVTGDNCTVNINTNLTELAISGSGCSVNVGADYKADKVTLRDISSSCNVSLLSCDTLQVNGSNNKVVADGNVSAVTLDGTNCSVTGSGNVEKLVLESRSGYQDIKSESFTDNVDYGIDSATVTLNAPSVLEAGKTLSVSVDITNPYTRQCTAEWTLDGKVVSSKTVTVGPTTTTLKMINNYKYTENMSLKSTVGFTLSYTDNTGYTKVIAKTADVTLKNYDYEFYHHVTYAQALSTVTSGYIGDYTTQWALENDYSSDIKTAWVNAKGYSSTSQYLVWINITYQRVNVFQGSQGNWKLIHTFLGGTGASGTSTPVGVYTVFGRSARGWITSTYCVSPVVNFKVGSGLAFHSRLYDPTRSYLTSAAIGYPCSHGCIRMYDEDVQWIYDNIPTGTTVVVY